MCCIMVFVVVNIDGLFIEFMSLVHVVYRLTWRCLAIYIVCCRSLTRFGDMYRFAGDNTQKGTCLLPIVVIAWTPASILAREIDMDEEFIAVYAAIAAYLIHLRGAARQRAVGRRPRRFWRRAMLARRRTSSHFFTLMQELTDGNFTFPNHFNCYFMLVFIESQCKFTTLFKESKSWT